MAPLGHLASNGSVQTFPIASNSEMRDRLSSGRLSPQSCAKSGALGISCQHLLSGYAVSLLASTSKEHLVEPDKPKKVKGLTERQMDMMSRESASLDKEFKMVEQTYGGDHLDLVLTVGYLRKLLDNQQISRYLERNHEEIHVEFRRLVESCQGSS